MSSLYAVILAGGVGARLWPRSRQTRPKQFTDITGNGRTMIQDTADRLVGLVDPAHLFVVTGTQYAGIVAEQLPAMPTDQILVEPSGRNTAPAIGLAALHVRRHAPDAVMIVLSSDHFIGDPAAFRAALAGAARAASAGHIVTLGIEPTFPNTGYGYIQRGAQLDIDPTLELPVFAVHQFLEKPNRSTAESFLADGGYYWNGGIFVSQVDRMLAEIQRQLPAANAILTQIQTLLDAGADPAAQSALLEQIWDQMPSISIDHGVMEGAASVAVVPLRAGWSDVGSWDALESILQQNGADNLVVKGDIITIDSRDNIVYADKQIVALLGVNDLVVVDSGDTLLIGHKRQMQRVKEIVERLRAQGRSDLL